MRPRWSIVLASALSACSIPSVLASGPNTPPSPSPLAFQPNQYFDGIDGYWSTFTVGIGNPPQFVRTLVSWAAYQTWAVLPAGCHSSGDLHKCAHARGGLYHEGDSTTFQSVGVHELGIEKNLGYGGNATFGYDTVGLGGPGQEGPTLNHTVVGGLTHDDFYLGIFGVNPRPTNFTGGSDGTPSVMTLLAQQGSIPSVSFAYTAGASYKDNAPFASLTLGGYDSSLVDDNGVVFPFATVIPGGIIVGIQDITTPSGSGSESGSSSGTTSLLPSGIWAYMDATVAEIWLPESACEMFESTFGLTYDDATDLYLVSESLHSKLKQRNPSITFTLATNLDQGETVSIKLPYNAFDLMASAPYQGLSKASYYFPLRRAMNNTQYTIGRTFFQEAYIRVDYETQTFNVSQRIWDRNAITNLVAIPPSNPSETNRYPGVPIGSAPLPHDLSDGAVAGIVLGSIAGLAIAATCFYFFFLKRRFRIVRTDRHEKLSSEAGSTRDLTTAGLGSESVYPKYELAGSLPALRTNPDDLRMQAPRELDSAASSNSPLIWLGDLSREQSSSGTGAALTPVSPPKQPVIYEMPADTPSFAEKDGKELSEKEALARREMIYNGVGPAPASSPKIEAGVIEEVVSPLRPADAVATWPSGSGDEVAPGIHRAFSWEDGAGSNVVSPG